MLTMPQAQELSHGTEKEEEEVEKEEKNEEKEGREETGRGGGKDIKRCQNNSAP